MKHTPKNLMRREFWRGFINAQDKYQVIRSHTDMKELETEYRKYIKLNPDVKKDIKSLNLKSNL